jgi:hypothetical protein
MQDGWFNSLLTASKGKYWVLDTDYDNYALTYSCVNILSIKYQEVSVLSRKRKLSNSIISALKSKIIEIDDTLVFSIRNIDQTECF